MNLFKRFQRLIPTAPLYVGTVESVDTSQVVLREVSGLVVTVRGEAAVGDTVYVRNGVIESIAPALTYVEAEE